MGRLGEAQLNTTPSATTHALSPIVRSARYRRLRRPRWGTAGHKAEPGRSCLAQTLDGTAGRRPNRGCGPRAAAEATRHNVTKPHRPRTWLRERWVGVRVKPEQAPQGATGRGLGWSRGPQVDRRRSTISEQSCGRRTGGAIVSSYMCHRSRISITNCNRPNTIAAQHRIWALQERD